jgi:hypothetical protein
MNIQVKFKYHFPHYQFLWYLLYIIEKNTDDVQKNDGENTCCLSIEDLIHLHNVGTVRYVYSIVHLIMH